MTLKFYEEANGRILIVRASGKVSKTDFEQLVPLTERLIDEFGRIRILFEMHDFCGWDVSGLWEDIKFDLKHFKDIDRLAIVGDSVWEHGMAIFCLPFSTAEIQYFDHSQIAEALSWIYQGVTTPA